MKNSILKHISISKLGGGGITSICHCKQIRRIYIAINLAILTFTIPPNLHSEELREICTSDSRCVISSHKSLITNHGTFNLKGESSYNDGIYIQGTSTFVIDSFINYGEIITHNERQEIGVFSFGIQDGQNITNLTNYGKISGGISFSRTQDKTMTINNYGTMGGVSATQATIVLNNFGIFNLVSYSNSNAKKAHFHNTSLTIQNHTMQITENASVFNSFDGNATDNSHLVLDSVTSVSFADSSAKMILDFGGDFEAGKEYALNKLIVDATNGSNKLSVDFPRLIPQNDIYTLTQSGQYFIAKLAPEYSTIGNLYKSNIRTMNNFHTISNSMIYPRKSYHSQNLGSLSLRASEYERGNPFALSSLRASEYERGNLFIKESIDSALDSAFPLKSYESFAYRSESQNRRIQRQNKRNYNKRLPNQSNSQNLKENQRNSQNLNADSANQQSSSLRADSQNLRGNPQNQRDSQNQTQTQRISQNQSQNPHDYYFILTPFVNYNSFAQSGNYNLSGFDYGFLTAFSGKVAESNHLGTHFIFSYGKLGDKQDKDLSIKSLNLNIGLNYKLDLIWDMYLKARGDFYYFLNAIDSLTIKNIKPNNLGFGASVIFGKDFNFGKGGIFGIEAGIDYKALKTNEVSLNSQTYKQSLLNLIYADVGVNYSKYFGGFGINLGSGFKANLAPKLAKSTLLVNTNNLTFTIDNDKYLAYANAGISYMLNTKNFDMEFSLQYFGNFGDRGISNGGGVEWRVEF